jgi:hypothetical protein
MLAWMPIECQELLLCYSNRLWKTFRVGHPELEAGSEAANQEPAVKRGLPADAVRLTVSAKVVALRFFKPVRKTRAPMIYHFQ